VVELDLVGGGADGLVAVNCSLSMRYSWGGSHLATLVSVEI
jgi:hypothetical protein